MPLHPLLFHRKPGAATVMALAVALTASCHRGVPAQDAAFQRAQQMEAEAERLLLESTAASLSQAAELFAEAAAIWTPDAGRLYERAGMTALAAGDEWVATRHYARALRASTPGMDSALLLQLEDSPVSQPDAERGASEFLEDTRAFASTLDLEGVDRLAGSLETAAEAQAFLELLYATDRTTQVRIRSARARLEVQVLEVVAFIYGGSPRIVRTDTTLVVEPVGYDFCYLDPETGHAMRFQQNCSRGCVVELPSDFAIRTQSCASLDPILNR